MARIHSTLRCHFAPSGYGTVNIGLFEDVDCGSDILEKAAANFDFYFINEERNSLAEAKFPGISTITRPDYSLSMDFIPKVRETTLH